MNKRRRFKAKRARAIKNRIYHRENRIRNLERKGYQVIREEHLR